MAIFSGKTVTLTVNSVDLSNHVASVSWSETAEAIETTAFGDTAVTREVAGFTDGEISIEFHQDFAASSVYATLKGLLGTTTTVTLKPTSASTAATNPLRSVSCFVSEIPILDVAAGELATNSVSWAFSGPVTESTS